MPNIPEIPPDDAPEATAQMPSVSEREAPAANPETLQALGATSIPLEARPPARRIRRPSEEERNDPYWRHWHTPTTAAIGRLLENPLRSNLHIRQLVLLLSDSDPLPQTDFDAVQRIATYDLRLIRQSAQRLQIVPAHFLPMVLDGSIADPHNLADLAVNIFRRRVEVSTLIGFSSLLGFAKAVYRDTLTKNEVHNYIAALKSHPNLAVDPPTGRPLNGFYLTS